MRILREHCGDVMMTENNVKYRVEQLEKTCMDLDTKIDKIMTNHLPHIELQLVKMRTTMNVWMSINIGAIIITAIVAQLAGKLL